MNAADGNGAGWLDGALEVFRYHKDLADRAVVQLSDDQLREALDPNTNSIAVIMKHIAGNFVSRWTDFLTTDGEKPTRDRDQEFVDTFASRDELMQYWTRGWNCLFMTLRGLAPDDMQKTVVIRGQPHTVPLAIERSLGHTAYHVGQIVLIARVLARDNWQTLTIPRGQSKTYNEQHWGEPASGHERSTTSNRPS